MRIPTGRARAAFADAWQMLCLFVVEECQPPDALRRIWVAVMWGFVLVAAWLAIVLGGLLVLLVLAALLAASFGIS